uniref:Uncharacterized protein n=1 Tax=Lactuca sativa TaxID=4236 RepID=A0A9R1WS45_LACSA|nr:hypothetical protein LSAT_V11C900462480 [Lactuca sativa]
MDLDTLSNRIFVLIHACPSVSALEFTHYTLPLATIKDMDSMNNAALAHNLAYAAVQSMTYLDAISRCVQRLIDLEHAHFALIASEASLKGKVTDLGPTGHRLDQQNKSLVSEKLVLEDMRSALESQVESLTQANEGLMIQNESLKCDLVDRERELEMLRVDRSWLLQVGRVRVMDKLIEHPEFTGGISCIHHTTFVASEELGRVGLKAQVDTRTYDPFANDSRLSHSSTLDDALLDFVTMDFAGLLGLGLLDVDGVKALCVFDEGEDVGTGLVEGNVVGVVKGGVGGLGADDVGTSVGGDGV